jgi:hypothetical protein
MKTGNRLCLAVAVLAAGCGTKEAAAPPQAAPAAAATAAPATTTTTTTTLPPPVWRTVRWGLTRDEVLAALPGEAQRLGTPAAYGPSLPGATDVAIPSYEADGAAFRVLFGFADSGLDRIHLTVIKPGDSSCADLEQKLTEKYAAPAARNAVGTSLRGEEIVWKRPDQTITLACSGVSSLGFPSVCLMFTPPR